MFNAILELREGKQYCQKQAVKHRRHRTDINNLVNMACHVTEHARKLTIGLWMNKVCGYSGRCYPGYGEGIY